MILKYKIIEVHPEQHSIVVRFYTDLVTEDSLSIQKDESGKILRGRTDFNIDLPIPAPTGQELDLFISSRAPRAWLETQESVLDPLVDTTLQDMLNLIGVEKVTTPPVPVTNFTRPIVLAAKTI